jgi:hypothetical protein
VARRRAHPDPDLAHLIRHTGREPTAAHPGVGVSQRGQLAEQDVDAERLEVLDVRDVDHRLRRRRLGSEAHSKMS